jgi:hypothetical protein
MADVPVPGIRKYWTQKLSLLKSECHAITNKYADAASVAQQVHRGLSGIDNHAGCTPAEVEESSSGPLLLTVRRRTEQTFVKV